MIGHLVSFLQHGLWRVRIRTLPKYQYVLFRQLRIVMLAIRGFAEDRCQLRASALTFFTLLSIVPVVAMAFGVAKGFGFDQHLESILMEKMHGQEEVMAQVLEFSNAMLANTKGGLIAGVGIALLFWAVIKLLGNIENSFNAIWGIKRGRSMGRKFSDYLSVMLICPLLLIVASSMTVFITSQVTMVAAQLAVLGPVSALILLSLKIIPYAIVWTLFTFIYLFMPNTKVSFSAGVLAGITAGTIYQCVQWAYIFFQMGVAKYNAIYGSFAALPMFLVWLQASWLVVLFGAEISFAVDNEETFELEHDSKHTSHRFKRLLSLKIVEICAKHFDGQGPLDVRTIAGQLDAPIRLVRELLFELVEANVLSEVTDGNAKSERYQPAQDIGQLTLKHVLDLMDRHGNDDVTVVNEQALAGISQHMEALDTLVRQSSDNVPLTSL
jgi:membrane protein